MNRRNKILGVILFCTLILLSCKESGSFSDEDKNDDDVIYSNTDDVTRTVLSVKDYIMWMQDLKNGFRKEKNMGDLNFILQYKPYEYIICMEEREEKIYDTLLKSRINDLSGIQYYDLKILLNEKEGELLKYNLSSNDEYEKRIKYFAYEMQNDIELVEGNDTLPCILYHFERTYDVAPYCTVLVGFNKKEGDSEKQRTFLFHDKTFNKGLLKFTFKENRLKNLPKLETI